MTRHIPKRAEVAEIQVPLHDGSSIAVTVRNAGSPPVLAIHGISSNSRLWTWLIQVAPNMSLVMPDLRGRGQSLHTGGSPKSGSSIQQHAEDLVAVLDHLGIDVADVLGMSMGGFVAVAMAASFPHRVRSLTLIDGGPPMRPPPGLEALTAKSDVAHTAMKDRLQRLGRRWTVQEYKEFFVSATAPLLSQQDPLLERYLRYDLGIEGQDDKDSGTVRLSMEWVVADAGEIFSHSSKIRWEDPNVRGVPTRLSWAQWAVGKDTRPAYGTNERKLLKDRLLREERVVGQDHAGSIMTLEGATIAASLLSDVLQMDLA